METSKADVARANAPSYLSFGVQEHAQTGMIHLIFVNREPGTGGLTTQEFYETQNHGGEVGSFKPVDWNEKIPEGSPLQGASAGNHNDHYNMYWTCWTDSSRIHALAITQEDPIAAPLLPGDLVIHAPIQYLDKKLRIFFWRKSGSGYALYNHVFSGEAKTKGSVATEKILEVPYEPLNSAGDPIAMKWVPKKGFEDAGLAVIGWLSESGGEMKAHALWLDAHGKKVFDSDSISGYLPQRRQRIALWADPAGLVHMAWLMERKDAGTVRMAHWQVDTRDGSKNLRINEAGHSGKSVRSSACVITRNPEEPSASAFLLLETGELYLDEDGRKPKLLRSHVPLSYDFPVFASALGTWEARYNEKGAIFFASPFN